jgi:hypothetical protein
MFQQISYATRTLFNALINGNRGYQAPYTDDEKAVSVEAHAMLAKGGPHVLNHEPAVDLKICVVPQAADFVHVAAQSRMLPAFSLESTSGGWVAPSYAFDPPPDIPTVILPQAQWNTFGGEINLTGLTTQPAPVGEIYGLDGMPMPGFAYPGIIGSTDIVSGDEVTNGSM